jgi:hypothetical protein
MPGVLFGSEFTSPRPLAQRGDQIIQGIVAVQTGFGRVLTWQENGFQHSNPLDGQVSGLCVTTEVAAGDRADLLTHGLAESEDWTDTTGGQLLVKDAPYYLVSDGKLSTIPSSEGYIFRVGRAVSTKILYVTFDLKVA